MYEWLRPEYRIIPAETTIPSELQHAALQWWRGKIISIECIHEILSMVEDLTIFAIEWAMFNMSYKTDQKSTAGIKCIPADLCRRRSGMR